MINHHVLLIAKYVVGSTWVLGLLELRFQVTPIPPMWLWVLVIVSLALHLLQAIYFYITYRQQVKNMLPHLAQIMIFGMAHVLTMNLKNREPAKKANE